MVSIVHTADVHLDDAHPERASALETVIETAEANGVSVLTIGGDLFHDSSEIDAIRPTLRSDHFADRDLEVVIIPGNHDREGFRGNTHFGDSAAVLVDEPFEHYVPADGTCRITGVPFVDRPDESLFVELADRPPFDGPEVLLVHCSLDVGVAAADIGDEDERRYFPVTPAQLGELDFEFVLAGHFHQPRKEHLSTGTFAYPGTPASTRRSETGPRSVATVDLEADELSFETLETFHHEETAVTVLPGREPAAFETIEAWVEQTVDAHTEAHVEVTGFHRLDEGAFETRLDSITPGVRVDNQTVTVDTIERHPLYREFDDRLAATDWDENTTDAVREVALEAFTRIRGEL